MEVIKLFDLQNGEVVPTIHCYTIDYLKKFMENRPDDYLKVYKFLFYMTCPNPELNPYFNMEDIHKEEYIIKDIDADFSSEDDDINYALQRCNKMYETSTSRAYYGIKNMMDRLARYMNDSTIKDGRDGNGAFILNAAKNFDSIRASYKGVYKDLMDEQKSNIRGGADLAYDQ